MFGEMGLERFNVDDGLASPTLRLRKDIASCVHVRKSARSSLASTLRR